MKVRLEGHDAAAATVAVLSAWVSCGFYSNSRWAGSISLEELGLQNLQPWARFLGIL